VSPVCLATEPAFSSGGLTEWLTLSFFEVFQEGVSSLKLWLVLKVALIVGAWLSLRFIPNNKVGVVEKLWSIQGSVPEGRIMAQFSEAGFQIRLLRGGIHFGFWRWQYRIHRAPLVTVPQGQIAYVYARDGESLAPSQTLGRIVDCDNFQNGSKFLHDEADQPRGQRGRQRAILREGVYAINPAAFVVIASEHVFALPSLMDKHEQKTLKTWQLELAAVEGFQPVIVGKPIDAPDPIHQELTLAVDSIGIVTVHDGPSLPSEEIIAPPVGIDSAQPHFHNNFQDPEAFLSAGGRRGLQYQTLTDGTYFINRWFATVKPMPKTVVPIGYVGVVVSYYGSKGQDVSGTSFRHGERVGDGERGVRERPFGPGKYAFNTYAGNIVLVPTTNFVLHWITGRTETHRYDETLKSIELVTRDAYEPALPLSVVVHIDYQRAPSVIQRFGDVKRLITQTLDPLLSAYFRDIAHRKTMLELLHERDVIQKEAHDELQRRFREFDIECVDVLIGKPSTDEKGGKIETLLEQLRLRQLSIEQLETFQHQRNAADGLRVLNDAQAQAAMQTELTKARLQVQVSESQGEAALARSRRDAEQTVVLAKADGQKTLVLAEAEGQRAVTLAKAKNQQIGLLAEAESQRSVLLGRGQAQQILQTGVAEASVLVQKAASYGDPRLMALVKAVDGLAQATQPLVPERLILAGGHGDGSVDSTHGLVGLLLQLLIADKAGIDIAVPTVPNGFRTQVEELTSTTLAQLQAAASENSRSSSGVP